MKQYNTEDGQIVWLEKNGFGGIHLGNFWSVIPMEVRAVMTKWKVILMTFSDAKAMYA